MGKVGSCTLLVDPECSVDLLQPAGGSGFQPINTLNGNRGIVRPSKPKVYGKSLGSSLTPRISQSIGPGQLAFLDRQQLKSSGVPARKTPSRQESLHRSGEESPSKRRKTEHFSPTNVIDFTLDDEVQEVTPHRDVETPRPSQHDASHSIRSSQPRRSIDSGHTLAGRRPAPGMMSACKAVDDFVKQSKARGKQPRQETQRRSSRDRVVSGSAPPHLRESPIQVYDDEPVIVAQPARTVILVDFSQGDPNVLSKKPKVTSPFFPNARINESSVDVYGQKGHARKTNGSEANLRDFEPARGGEIEDDISDDELAIEPPQKKNIVRRQVSPSKTSQTANRVVKGKQKAEKTEQGWPLNWARTHVHDELWGARFDDKEPRSLQLKPGEGRGTWDIIQTNAAHPYGVFRAHIKPKDVIKCQADDIGRIRLEGSRQQDGNTPIFDLDFHEPQHFRKFRDEHAQALAMPGKILMREDKHMQMLFNKPLQKNDKVGASALIADAVTTANDETGSTIWTSKTPLLDHIIAGPRGATSDTVTKINDGSTGAVKSTRPTRSTRSAAAVHDAERVSPEAVEKYSIVHGLGTKWQTPLTYGNGRQKAVVDFGDLPRLDEDEMLNDSLIDFYMIWLFDKYQVPKDKVYFFNTFFYSKLTEKTGRSSMNYEAVKRWTAKIDVFGYDYIVVPIHEQIHWYLAIICNVNNIGRKPIQEDFGENVVEKQPPSETSLPVVSAKPAELITGAEPLSLVGPIAVDAPNETFQEQIDGNQINLFDEESRLDLVDRDDTGTDAERSKMANASSRPQSPRNGALVVPDALDQSAVPDTVVSAPNAPVERKKKVKRKPPVIKRDPSQPVVVVLDSLGNPHSNVVRSLKDWLAAVGQDQRGMDVVIKENGVYPKGDQIPTQENWTDCGLYVLGYVEKFFQDPDAFKRKLLTGEMTAEDDWPKLKPVEMRNNLRDLLFQLAGEQKLTVPKKKKAKKAAAATQPTPAEAPRADEKHQLSPDQHVALTGTVDTKSETGKLVASEKGTVVEETQQIVEHARPRLGSPIQLGPHSKVSESGADSTKDRSPEIVVDKVSDSPPVLLSPTKRTSMSQTPGRSMSPRAQIPKSPVPPQLVQKGNHIEVSPESVAGTLHRILRQDQSASPKKRSKQIADADIELRTPGVKKKVKPSSVQKKVPASRASPSLYGQRDGSSDQPIEIIDSQDMMHEATQSPAKFRSDSPAKRNLSSRSPNKTQALRPTPSLEEILPPQHRDSPRKRRQAEKGIGHRLEAKLDEADDEARKQTRLSTFPDSLEYVGENDSDAMEIDSRGGDPMDLADDTIRETPEAAWKSPEPEWSRSQPLPM